MCQQASVSVCASEKGKPVVRRGRKAHGPPSWEVAGLSNSGGGALLPRRHKGGADATLRRTQPYEPRVSLILWNPLDCFAAGRAGGLADDRGALRHSYLRPGDRPDLMRQTSRWAPPHRCSRISSSPSGGLWSEV